MESDHEWYDNLMPENYQWILKTRSVNLVLISVFRRRKARKASWRSTQARGRLESFWWNTTMNEENCTMQRVPRIQTKRSNDTNSPFRPKPSVYLILFMSIYLQASADEKPLYWTRRAVGLLTMGLIWITTAGESGHKHPSCDFKNSWLLWCMHSPN